MLVLDCDGVLTDGVLVYGPGGEVLQRFSVYDGYGLECLRREGVEVAVLTGRRSAALTHRAQGLGIRRVVQGASDKAAALLDLAKQCGVKPEEIAYVGDDVFDVPAMELCGWSAAPANARPEARKAASHVCRSQGGHGAVREVAEEILRAKGKWPPRGVPPAAEST